MSSLLLFMPRFAACATTHKPLLLPVPEPSMSRSAGAAASHHRRQYLPRKIPPAPQVLSRVAACTRREARLLWRRPAARGDHCHLHLHPPDLHRARRSQPQDRYLRCLLSCILYSFDFESSPSVRAGSRSGGSARTRGAPERVFAEPGATAAPLRDPRPAAAAAAAVRSALERARPARRARVHAHVSSLLSPFRRLIRSLLVLAGSGDAEPRDVSRGRCQPAAAVVPA
jgi:hypothetical protein